MTDTNDTAPVATGTANRLDPALLKLSGIVVVRAVAVQLDATIVNVAIDKLGRDFHAGLSTIQWVGASFGTAVLAVILQHQSAGQTGPAGLASAFGQTFWWAVGFTALAFIAALLLPRTRPHRAAAASVSVT